MNERVDRWGEVRPEPQPPLTHVPVAERVVYLVMIPLLLFFPAVWIPPLAYLVVVRKTPAGPGAAQALLYAFYAAGSLGGVLLALLVLRDHVAQVLAVGVVVAVVWACVFVWHGLRRF